MNMCIIMNMNIYINKDNEEKLRQLEDWTMSGLINNLLETFFEKHDVMDFKNQVEPYVLKKIIDDKYPAKKKPLNTETKDYSLCKHGNIKGFCKQGCK